jgi:hypothetical protein
MNDEGRLSSGPRVITCEQPSAEGGDRHVLERELGRLRGGIVHAIEAFGDGDPDYALDILCALDDAPPATAKPVACPYCSLRFEWPGLRDHHLLMSHPDAPGAMRVAA